MSGTRTGSGRAGGSNAAYTVSAGGGSSRAGAGRTPLTCGRGVYVHADAAGVSGEHGVVHGWSVDQGYEAVQATCVTGGDRAVRRRSVSRAHRPDPSRPSAGVSAYEERPRHGAYGSRVSRTARPSHDQDRSRLSGLSAVTAAAVITFAFVIGLGAVADLAAGPGSVPTQTAVVQVRSGESLTAVASRVAPGAPADEVVARIMTLNDMPSAAVQPGQALIAPVSTAG